MKGTFDLVNPIYINDKEVKALNYDTNEITVSMFAEADARKKTKAGGQIGVAATAAVDSGLHLYLGMMAVIALDNAIALSDLERMKGFDVAQLVSVGQRFFIRPSEERSRQSASAEQSETTVEPSTPPGETSTNED